MDIKEQYIWFYYKQGFSIIPVKRDKTPNIPTWRDFQYKSPSEEQIQDWITKGLFDNIGIICGAVSGNLVVIDIDDGSLIDKLGIKLDKTREKGWVSKTGRGYHIYLKSDSNPGETIKYADLKLEKRCNGAYIVAPPSIHPNGSQYEFIGVKSPDELKPLFTTEFSDIELIWTDFLLRVSKLLGIKMEQADIPIKMENIEADCIANIFKGVPEGKRDDTAYALTHYYYYIKKMNPTEVKSLVLSWNKRNKPSLSESDIQRIINSAMKAKDKTGCRKLISLGFCPYKIKKDCPFINPNITRKQYDSPPANLTEVYERLHKWFYINDTNRIDLLLATALSNQYKGTPLWIFFVGASGDLKSGLLTGIEGMPNVRKIDQLTANTLASGKMDAKDLGSELQDKSTILMFSDLACLTSLNKDEKKKIWAQFRNLYDGQIYKDTGERTEIKYDNCHVTVLACTTSAIKEEYLINAQLGTREIMYDTEPDPREDIEKMKKALEHDGKEKQMKQEVKETMQGFLDKREFDETIQVPDEILYFLFLECEKLKLLRATAPIDWNSGELSNDAEPEVPTRLIKQFQLLYKSLKSLDENYQDNKFKDIIEHIVKSSSDKVRYNIYNIFKSNGSDWLNVVDIQQRMRIGRKAIISQCDLLWNLGSLDRKVEDEQIGGFVMEINGIETKRGGRYEKVNYYKIRSKTNTQINIDN